MTIDEETQLPVPVGTTVRFYDQRIDAWRSIWISPTQSAVKTFTGRKILVSTASPNSFLGETSWHLEFGGVYPLLHS
ncbi:MAG: hypothetical protein AUF79_03040 [Crenarchaeota archaeon 13_1_20CM_2_51_8]|nr:MAG: hypothetical protein AUF79_03040 [Crenarchaeota archaeon 13_1_20CM_2_51_8]